MFNFPFISAISPQIQTMQRIFALSKKGTRLALKKAKAKFELKGEVKTMNTALTMPLPAAFKKKILRAEDFICRRCRVQPTREIDRVCEICKAFGKTAEPVVEIDFRDGLRLGIVWAKRHFFGSQI